MSSLSARLLKRKHISNNDILEIIEETKHCLNINNDSNCNNLLNKLEIQSLSLSSTFDCNSVSQIEKKILHHRYRIKKKSRIIDLNRKTTVSINKHKINTNLNENNDKQLDLFENKSNIPNVISWWEDNQQEIFKNNNEHDDDILKTSDENLQKIVDGALNLMLTNSKSKIQKQIKTFIDRKKLKRNRRHIQSKNAHIDFHSERNAQLLKTNDIITPINSSNLGHQLLEKIGWMPGNGLGINQNGIKIPIEVNIHNHRQGLGYEKSIDRYQ
ncbi:unnamed protein product [Rotaria sp. Silwood1]|nr:unnamed protein product [Rotaria sp. Silwood1]CAF1445095.1 unnamed protein product [Rotaria sp. Silwood1]CAF3728917.1 unnamed protein product [Rotaria sp. Silwood1]CAF4939652.1 unnamed protein product [Rotaria sp. Silwood1]